MKINTKNILIYLTIFVCGVMLGGMSIFFLTNQISRQFINTYTINTVSYNFSKNAGLLSQLRSSKIEKAINSLESDLDIAIVELHSRLKDNDGISNDYKNMIEEKLKYAKQYRLSNPYINSNEKIGKRVEGALADVQIK